MARLSIFLLYQHYLSSWSEVIYVPAATSRWLYFMLVAPPKQSKMFTFLPPVSDSLPGDITSLRRRLPLLAPWKQRWQTRREETFWAAAWNCGTSEGV